MVNFSVNPMEFASHASRESERLLVLDYDGTLAPFKPSRSEAVPYEGIRERMERIQLAGARIVLISGRGAQEVAQLLDVNPRPEIWGCHGWERWRTTEETPKLTELPPQLRKELDGIFEAVSREVCEERIELKATGVAVHWRGVTHDEIAATKVKLENAWRPWINHELIEWHSFDGGVEMRAKGRNKGDALRTLLDEYPESVSAFLGDDLTDEDAFHAIKGRGLGVLVRKHARPTYAEAWLRPPEELIEFLDLWMSDTPEVALTGKKASD